MAAPSTTFCRRKRSCPCSRGENCLKAGCSISFLHVLLLVLGMPVPGEQECSQHLVQELFLATLSSTAIILLGGSRTLALCGPFCCFHHYLQSLCHLLLPPIPAVALLVEGWGEQVTVLYCPICPRGHSGAVNCEEPTGGRERRGDGAGTGQW